MNDKKRFALAEKIQKRIQEKHPHFHLIQRRDEIEKQLKDKKANCRSQIKSSTQVICLPKSKSRTKN
jgi:hypothetical protein